MASFHYAFKVKDIESTRNFYVDILGCKEGRSTGTWIDFNFLTISFLLTLVIIYPN